MKHPEAGNPRGLLKASVPAGQFHHARRLASENLRPFVAHYWIVRWDLQGHQPQIREVLPHPSVHLLLEQGRSCIAGVSTGKFTRVIEGRGQVFGIKFRPGGFYAFAKLPVSDFTDRTVPVGSIFGPEGEALEALVLSLESDDEMIETADQFLLARLPEQDEQGMLAGRIVDRAASDRAIVKVDDLIREFHIGKRSLQRLFRDYVGVTPKWVIQRYRLHEALEQLADAPSADWSRIATDLGYFDQAHFIKDFKSIIGRTPLEYSRHASARPSNRE